MFTKIRKVNYIIFETEFGKWGALGAEFMFDISLHDLRWILEIVIQQITFFKVWDFSHPVDYTLAKLKMSDEHTWPKILFQET